MAQLDGTISTADQREGADAAPVVAARTRKSIPRPPRPPAPTLVRFWRSAIGKKWAMAVSGIALLGYVLAHMIGNLKVFLGREDINEYGEWLRDLGSPALPRTSVLWALRVALIAAFVIHIVAAAQLTRMNLQARPLRHRARREYAAASYASRTMRWTGVIVGLFVVFHLLDLTWGSANPAFERGNPYDNMISSFQREGVAAVYILANLALALHIFHGAWSMFQSLGLNNPRYNSWRRYFATTFAVVIALGNVSMPLLITTGVYP